MKTEKLINLSRILCIVTILLLGVQLWLSGNISSENKEMGTIEARIDEVKKENRFFEEQIARYTSLSYLQEQAFILGFDKPVSLVDYSGEKPVALRR